MRRIVMFNHVTADGYFAGPDGNLNWVVPSDELDKEAVRAIAGFDTVLLGRRTYELFAAFWPHVVDDSPTVQDPHDAGRKSKELRALAVALNEITKLVFSKTLKEATWRNSKLVPELNPREIEAMKRQPGKDMILFGSGSIVSQLTQHGLIDEYQFIVSPILLGKGTPMLSDLPRSSKLDLVETRGYPTGNVMLRYGRSS